MMTLTPTRRALATGLLAALLATPFGGSPAAAQDRTRIRPAPPAPPAPPAAPIAPLARQAPRPAPAPFPHIPDIPVPPIPPIGPFTFDLDLDAITDSAWQAADSVRNLDLDAIRESAQRAAEAGQAFAYAFPPDGFAFGPPQPWRGAGEPQAEALYRTARNLIDHGRYEKALEQLDRLIEMSDTAGGKGIGSGKGTGKGTSESGKGTTGSGKVDAALYWRAYAQARLGQRAEALATLADVQKRFADSRWLKDAKALEVEVRQASGQPVSPDAQNDEELKLLALRGIMQTDPDRAVPMIERLLGGNSSVRLQENAMFVLAQSRSTAAREIIVKIAKGGSNPDVQLRAIRYLGMMGTVENRQILDDVYRSTTDASIKRAVLQAFMTAGAADRLIDIAKTERDGELRRTAIRGMGVTGAAKTGEALQSMYASDSSDDIRREIVNALFLQHNATALVALARAEKDPSRKKDIVSKLSLMKSKEGTEYLLELLK